jgi:8-oxo-dGTP pyrophosphatase MutT (NUDIX family)
MIVAQKYKVFINDKVVFFQDTNDGVNINGSNVLLNPTNSDDVVLFIEKNTQNNQPVYVVGKKCFDTFFSSYKYIEAAGGAVFNTRNELLFIYRLKKWDLPKGKIEKGEDIESAALREVEEECGVDGLTIIKELSPTYHTYVLKGKNVLKKTYWFLMQTNFNGELIPQIEEDIEAVEWMKLDDIKGVVFPNTYPAIIDVVRELNNLKS